LIFSASSGRREVIAASPRRESSASRPTTPFNEYLQPRAPRGGYLAQWALLRDAQAADRRVAASGGIRVNGIAHKGAAGLWRLMTRLLGLGLVTSAM